MTTQVTDPRPEPVQPEMGPPSLEKIESSARRAERRLRIRRAIVWGAKGLAAAMVVAAVLLVLRKIGVLPEKATRIGLVACVVQAVVVAALGFSQRLPRRAGAVALDRFHQLADRLSSALSFSELPAQERTPFMMAAIDDALEHAKRVDPKRAVPMERPREWPFLLIMVGALAGIALFEVRKHTPTTNARMIDAVDVTQDDLDAMREFLRDVDQRMQSEDAKDATQEFNQLIEDLANKRLDRTEAFRRMQQLEDKLLRGNEADAKALEEALKKMGEELKKSELSKPTGEALDNKNLDAAEKALKDLAKKLREGKNVDKAQLEKLKEALKKASEENKKRLEELEKKREELKDSILKQKEKMADGGAPKEEEKSLLQKKERELERLEREHDQQQKAQRELDRLDRELQKAAEDLMKDLGLSANDLDNAAQDLNRMAKEEMSQEEKEQLRQKLQELREMLRQQSQGGAGQMARLRVFQQKAQGKGGQSGQGGQQGQGDQGQGDQGQGQQGQGQGQQGQGQGQQGQGQGQQGKGQGQGQGQGQGGGETWILGPNGEKILMITKSSGQGQGGQNGGGQGQGKGQGAGTGHDSNVQGKDPTALKSGTQDSQIQGNDTGQGGSRSEVILGAAERGFASRGYQKVYREYHTVAEEALNKDEIPGGYRFYVRRYFQLIRPREEGGGPAPAPAPPPTP